MSANSVFNQLIGLARDLNGQLFECKLQRKELKQQLYQSNKERAEFERKLAVALEALEKCKKIRRKDGNDNEYEGAESIIANEALAKINQK